jgi:hypothetical protein
MALFSAIGIAMGLSGIAATAVGAGVTAIAGVTLASGIQSLTAKAPKVPLPPRTPDVAQAQVTAAKEQRIRAVRRTKTILTSGQGLLAEPETEAGKKTLLGQ